MNGSADRMRRALIWSWTGAVIVFMYLPAVSLLLASSTSSRYFTFPITKWGFDWWQKTFVSLEVHQLFKTSLVIALCVTAVAVVIALFGPSLSRVMNGRAALSIRKSCCCRFSSRKRCWALRCCCGSTHLDFTMSWQTAVFAHLVWIIPVCTLVISIQVYSFDPALEEAAFDLGATRWQVFREVTLPVLFPGIFSGALFAFLLSWGNFPLSLYTTGADTTLPEYLYAKMIAGYTPGVPVLGTVSTIGAAILLIGSYGAILAMRRARQSATE